MCLKSHVTGASVDPVSCLVGHLKSVLTKRLAVLFSLTSPIVIYVRLIGCDEKGSCVPVVDTFEKQSLLSDIFPIDSPAVWVANAYLLHIFRYCKESYEDRVQRCVE